MLRARFTAHLLDEPGPHYGDLLDIFSAAVRDLFDEGWSVTDVSIVTLLSEDEIRRYLVRGASSGTRTASSAQAAG